MTILDPTHQVIASIKGGATWLQQVAIYGMCIEEFIDAEGQRDMRLVADSSAGPIWA